MNYETARAYVGRVYPKAPEERVSVTIPISTGTHHTIAVYERTPTGEYGEIWHEEYPSRIRELEIETKIGNIVFQHTTSPASAELLERYGVVVGDHRVDWGSDADWVVDFGPMGEVTRRGLRAPTSSFSVDRSRSVAAHGKETVGGAVEEVSTTSTPG